MLIYVIYKVSKQDISILNSFTYNATGTNDA